MNKKIIQPELTPHAALKTIKDLAKNTDNVFLIPHAKQSMKKRQITLSQIIECLLKGTITEGPYHEIGADNWRVRMEYFSSGQCIKVIAELITNDNNEKIIVITTFK